MRTRLEASNDDEAGKPRKAIRQYQRAARRQSEGNQRAKSIDLNKAVDVGSRTCPPATQKPQRLQRQSGQWSFARPAKQKLSQASTDESAASCGEHVRCAEQKPHALQSQRVQCAEACFSLQYPLQLSTPPSSCELAVHWPPPPEVIMPMLSPGLSLPPQKAHDLHAHALQCEPRCSGLHHLEHASYGRSLASLRVQARPLSGGRLLLEAGVRGAAGAKAPPAAWQKLHDWQSQRLQCVDACFSWQ